MRTSKRTAFQKLRIWSFRLLLGAVCVLLAMSLSLPYVVQIPAVHQALQQQISDFAGVNVRYDSVRWYFQDWLELTNAEVSFRNDQSNMTAKADRLRIEGLISKSPTIGLKNVQLLIDRNEVVSFPSATIELSTRDDKNVASLNLVGATIDIEALSPLLQSESSNETESFDPRLLGEVQWSNITLRIPGLLSKILWNGSLRTIPGTSLWRLTVRAKTQPSETLGTCRLDAEINPETFQLNRLALDAHSFPLAIHTPFPASTILDGGLRISNQDAAGYLVLGDYVLTDTSLEIPIDSTLLVTQTISAVTFSIDAQFNEQLQLQNVLILAEHTPAVVSSASREWNIPPGVLQAEIQNATQTAMSWTSPLGIVAATSSWPFSATKTITASVQVEHQPLKIFGDYIPYDIHHYLNQIEGFISLNSQAVINKGMLQEIDASATLNSFVYQTESLHAQQGDIQLNVKGNQKSILFDGAMSTAVEWISSGTASISLEPEIQWQGDYSIESGEGKVQFTGNAGWISEINAWMDSNTKWAASAILSLDDGIPSLRDAFLVEPLNELEGSGDLLLNATGDFNTIHLTGSSDELAIYSFAEEFSFGVQLQETDFSADAIMKDNLSASANLQTATTYISYEASDYEWDTGFTVALNSPSVDERSISITPPGGGLIQLKLMPDALLQCTMQDVSLPEFLLPVVYRFGLQSTDTPTDIQGKCDTTLTINLNPELSLNGNMTLKQLYFTQLGSPHISIKDGLLQLPVHYPFKQTEGMHINVESKSIEWDDAHYENVAFSIPLEDDPIRLVEQIYLPLFGGHFMAESLHLKEWLSGTPTLEGQIRLDQLRMENLGDVSSLFPAQGTLSGKISRIVAGAEGYQLDGSIDLNVFGGTMSVYDVVFIPKPDGDSTIRFNLLMTEIDLNALTHYFNFGRMTGTFSGWMKNVEIYLPPPGSNELPIPLSMDIMIESTMKKHGTISKEALDNIYTLSDTQVALSGFQKRIKAFDYQKLGIQIELRGNELRIVGTLPDSFLLSPAKRLFSHKIGIRLPDSRKVLSFSNFWKRLLSLTKRLG